MRRFIVTGSVALVLLGGVSSVLLPMLVEEEQAPAEVEATCVSVDDEARLAAMQAQGWREVPGRDGQRCFLESASPPDFIP